MFKEIQLEDCINKIKSNEPVYMLSKGSNGQFNSIVNLTDLLSNTVLLCDMKEEKTVKHDTKSANVSEKLEEGDGDVIDEILSESTDNNTEFKDRRRKVDVGKVIALYKAKWKVADIASDCKCTRTTVYKILENHNLR